jgi:hypothetical protein
MRGQVPIPFSVESPDETRGLAKWRLIPKERIREHRAVLRPELASLTSVNRTIVERKALRHIIRTHRESEGAPGSGFEPGFLGLPSPPKDGVQIVNQPPLRP